VDAALLGSDGTGGILPPTGGQAVAGPVAAAQDRSFVDPILTRTADRGMAATGQLDKQARVFEVTGSVKIAPKGSDNWQQAKIGTMIQEGDVVLTAKGGQASITFDERFLNVVYIPENTRAVFRSIEPTDIYLEDGTVYNVFDGLAPGSGWKVSSPVAVAAVRGTHYLVRYQKADGSYVTAVLDVPEDGESSEIKLIEVLDNGEEGKDLNIPEGFQIELKEGQSPDEDLIEKLDPEWLALIEDFMQSLDDERKKSNQKYVPATSGEFFEPGVIDPAGSGNVGGDPNEPFDPFQEGGIDPDDGQDVIPDDGSHDDYGDEGEGEGGEYGPWGYDGDGY